MRQRLQVVLQILLALVACLLGIVTNYAASKDDAPWALEMIQQWSVPAIGLLVVAMVVGQVVVYRLENPAPAPSEWPRDRIPYPGLDAFGEDEAAVYFGREAQAAELTRRLHASAPRSADRFLMLTGASGSGKSSLVRAGVMPRLRRRRWTIVPTFSPGPNPLHGLATSLAAAGGGRETPDAVLRRLRQGPESLAAELSRLRAGQFQRVLLVIVSFSPDATRLVTAGRDQVVRVWDAVSGEPVRQLAGAGDIGRRVAWPPDGTRIAATFRDQVAQVWEADSGRLVHELRGHTGDVWGVAWAPDSSRLATASHDRTVIVWDAATGAATATLTGHTEFVEGVAWSPDGESLATRSGGPHRPDLERPHGRPAAAAARSRGLRVEPGLLTRRPAARLPVVRPDGAHRQHRGREGGRGAARSR